MDLSKVIKNASIVARKNFKFFWRERFWEIRRTQKECEFASVLCSVSDEINGEKVYEQFWLSDVMFDGTYVYGTINNAPQIVKNVELGAYCTIPLSSLEDWMYVREGIVYGAFTLQAQRNFMKPDERDYHDSQWGHDFGDPIYPKKYPIIKKPEEPRRAEPKVFGITIPTSKLKKKALVHPHADVDWEIDHPDSLTRIVKYDKTYRADPQKVNQVDENGWTPLHNHALVGSRHIVQLLVELGADTSVQTQHGQTAKDLAQLVGWPEVVKIL